MFPPRVSPASHHPMPLTLCVLTFVLALSTPARADERIEAHLTSALDHVRTGDISTLPVETRARRAAAITSLERYIARGEFPVRTDDAFAGRRPRFIDARGVHCAVGQLIADSGHPELARAINAPTSTRTSTTSTSPRSSHGRSRTGSPSTSWHASSRATTHPRLQKSLRAGFSVGNRFRIDTDVRATATIPVELPAARDARIKKYLDESKRNRPWP